VAMLKMTKHQICD